MNSVPSARDPRRYVRFARGLALLAGLGAGCGTATGPRTEHDGAADGTRADARADDGDGAATPDGDAGCDPCLDRKTATRPLCADARLCGIGPLPPPELA
jgi:hypothetical protein